MRKFLILLCLLLINKFSLSIDSPNLPVGASAMGLGEAWVGEASDVWASWWNPAGLTQIKEQRLAMMHQEPLALGVPFDYFGYVQGKSNRNETYGCFISRLDYSQELGYNWFEDLIYFSYAKKQDENLSYGGNLKYLRVRTTSGSGSVSGSGYGLDLGILYKLDEDLKVGFMARNILTQINYDTGTKESLPISLSLGLSLHPDPISLVVLDFEGEKSPESDVDPTWGIHLGYERWVDEVIALRVGYLHKKRGENADYEKRFTAGVGLKMGPWDIDYAYDPTKSIYQVDDAHRISVTYKLK